MIIPTASPTGQMGGGLYHPNFEYLGQSIVGSAQYTYDHRYEIGAGATLLTPLTWYLRGPTVGAAVLWKLRQAGMLGLALRDSSGGGGPGESLTSTESPPSLEQIGKASEHTSSPAAAGNSAHGGRRSGSKPRKGHFGHWVFHRGRYECVHCGTKCRGRGERPLKEGNCRVRQ